MSARPGRTPGPGYANIFLLPYPYRPPPRGRGAIGAAARQAWQIILTKQLTN